MRWENPSASASALILTKPLRLADAALAIATRLDHAESLGRASRAKANALWYKGKFEIGRGILQ